MSVKARKPPRVSSTARRAGAKPDKSITPPRRHGTISKWGNSLGLRIPQEAVEHLRLKPGARVSMEVRNESILITPVRGSRKWTEAELLKGVTPEMVGGEVDWGPAVGREVW